MKIQRKEAGGTIRHCLVRWADVFEHEGCLFMKTSKDNTSVNLETGDIETIGSDTRVKTLLDATLVLEGAES